MLKISGLRADLTGGGRPSGPGRGGCLGQRHVSRAEAISFNRDPDKQGGEGPVATAAQEQYDNRAYPNTTIDFQQVVTSQQAAQAVKQHGKGKAAAAQSSSGAAAGAANSAPWTLIGPSADR